MILIKDMEMPKHDDEYVIFTVYGDGGVVYGSLNRPHVRYKNRAVPVPPHGRLIDADALLADVRAHSESYFADDFAHEWVDVAPTVIEAESYSERELQRDYEASVEYAQHCGRYEPTYNSDTGAM